MCLWDVGYILSGKMIFLSAECESTYFNGYFAMRAVMFLAGTNLTDAFLMELLKMLTSGNGLHQ